MPRQRQKSKCIPNEKGLRSSSWKKTICGLWHVLQPHLHLLHGSYVSNIHHNKDLNTDLHYHPLDQLICDMLRLQLHLCGEVNTVTKVASFNLRESCTAALWLLPLSNNFNHFNYATQHDDFIMADHELACSVSDRLWITMSSRCSEICVCVPSAVYGHTLLQHQSLEGIVKNHSRLAAETCNGNVSTQSLKSSSSHKSHKSWTRVILYWH